ncbi:MAG: peptide MFS transporter [Pseudomonadota bacterium]
MHSGSIGVKASPGGKNTTKRQRHPRGALLLMFTELWERFSFFGMKGILVLFLSSSLSEGGFGWDPARAIAFTGLYGGFVYLSGVAGGWFADRVIGISDSVVWGGFILVCGHLLLGGIELAPAIVEAVSGHDVKQLLIAVDVSLGRVWLDDSVRQQFESLNDPNATSAALFAMTLSSAFFYSGIVCIVIGTGLFKTPLTVLLGRLYDNRETMREEGFTLYYVGMNVGAFVAPFIVGSLAENVSWAWGFSAAAAGMILGLIVFLYRRGSLPDVGKSDASSGSYPVLSQREKRRLFGLTLLGAFAALFWIAFEQIFGFLNLFVFEKVDRNIFGFTVPATWFLSLNPILIVLLAPLLASLWTRLSLRGRNPNIVEKFCLGLVALSAAFGVLLITSLISSDGRFPAFAIILAYGLVTLSELVLWTSSLAFVTRISPPQIAGAVMGAWYLALALGSIGGGFVGAAISTLSTLNAFIILTGSVVMSMLTLFLMRPMISRYLDLNEMEKPVSSVGQSL